MASIRIDGSTIQVDTDLLAAEVRTEGYTSGVGAGSLLDKTTGARDLGFGLDIVDFLLEPLADEPGGTDTPYETGDANHGHLVKRYVELPQICTGARKVEYELLQGEGWVGVRQWFRYREATHGRKAGSLWEQTLVFRDGLRYFFSTDRVTSANEVPELILRIDMPGHLKHDRGDSFGQVYLSYEGCIPAAEFVEDFPPDARFLYQRGACPMPLCMIRGYQVRLDGKPGPWLAGMTLSPEDVSEAWCHQRGYVCFIQEIGGRQVGEGERFGASYVVGWFDDIEQMHSIYDRYRGLRDVLPG